MMRRARDLGNAAGWLIRSQHNRCLPDGGKLWAQTLDGEALAWRLARLVRLGRKSDGEPGVKTIWLDFARVMDFVEGVAHMRQFQNSVRSCV